MNGLYIGSFDMFTNGHLDILEQAVDLFDWVYVVVGVNPLKKRRYSIDSSMRFIREAIKNKPYVDKIIIDSTMNFATEYAISHSCNYLVRGLRNATDYAYEENLADVYKELYPDVRIMYFRTNFSYISSTVISELAQRNLDVRKYLPAPYRILEGSR